jgi:ubiquinone/menaquinone biosynthesis methyltransferase
MAIDGTKKWPEEGYTREWPDVCVSDEPTRRRVDAMWSELGIPLAVEARNDSITGQVEPELARRAAAPAAHASGNREMFDRIAPSYDRMNRLMTLGIDKGWRKKAVEMVRSAANGKVLDLCAGTLDLSAAIEQAYPEAKVVACDASERMLILGREKTQRVETVVGDALSMPFGNAEFDAVICGFGVRNLSDLRRGIREVRRVLKHGGVFVTLELFQPRGATSRFIHGAGLRYALPALGAAIAHDREAYAYLAESMEGFVTREAYETLLTEEGFGAIASTDLTLGMAALVRAEAR